MGLNVYEDDVEPADSLDRVAECSRLCEKEANGDHADFSSTQNVTC